MPSPFQRLLYLGSLLALAWSPLSFADTPRQQWHQAFAAGYAELARTSDTLAASAAGYCAEPDTDKRTALTEHWLQALRAWQAIRFVDFGPIEQNSLAWQFQFWPDAKNLVAQKAGIWLRGEQPITAEDIAADSVAVKGFPALEYLLFDPQLEQRQQALPADRSCQLLTGISAHVQRNAVALQSTWEIFGPHYLANDTYDATTLLAAVHALEILRDGRLGAPMGLRGNSRRNPFLADAWRSGQSLDTVQASLNGLREHFLPGLERLLIEQDKAELFQPFAQQLDSTLARLAELPADMGLLLNDDDGYRDLQLLHIEVEKLVALLNGGIARELGIVRGFNASDGD